MRNPSNFLLLLLLLFLCATASAQGTQQFASLGDFKVESGETIRDCKLGYRTFGQLNADKSNAVLFPTWFGGKSEQLAASVGKDKIVDDGKFFVIAVDALGNGVSSSPSNTAQFPALTIRDMVNAEYELVTRTFGIKKLHAVMGISMGGMQTFEWITAYPEMMTRAVPIVGTTHQTAYDLLLWSTQLRAIEQSRKSGLSEAEAGAMVARIHALALFTPSYRNSHTTPQEFQAFIEREEQNYKTSGLDNRAAQLKAMMSHDVAKRFDGSMSKAAWAVKAKTLVVVARQDHMVNPDPALDFARLLKADVIEINNDCGHVYASCEVHAVNEAIAKFLSAP